MNFKILLLALFSALLLLGCVYEKQAAIPAPSASASATPTPEIVEQELLADDLDEALSDLDELEGQQAQACFENGECVSLEIVDSPEERAVGLMNRTVLAPNWGMLFVFDQSGRHYFWMKNTLVALDMIWLDENQKIVGIRHALPCEAEPCPVYAPEDPDASAKFVVEVNSGFSEKNGVRQGQKIAFKNLD